MKTEMQNSEIIESSGKAQMEIQNDSFSSAVKTTCQSFKQMTTGGLSMNEEDEASRDVSNTECNAISNFFQQCSTENDDDDM